MLAQAQANYQEMRIKHQVEWKPKKRQQKWPLEVTFSGPFNGSWNCQFTWLRQKETLVSLAESLLKDSAFYDCQLCAEGHHINVHRVILSFNSPIFCNILQEHNSDFPVITLDGVSSIELKALVEYMYTGVTRISPDYLKNFFQTAKSLQLAGLNHNDSAQINTILNENDTQVDDAESQDNYEVYSQNILKYLDNSEASNDSETKELSSLNPNDESIFLDESAEPADIVSDNSIIYEKYDASFMKVENVEGGDPLEQHLIENVALSQDCEEGESNDVEERIGDTSIMFDKVRNIFIKNKDKAFDDNVATVYSIAKLDDFDMARQFRIYQNEILQYLNADDSGDETNLPLDEDDQEFLACNAEHVGAHFIVDPIVNMNINSTDTSTIKTAEPAAGPSEQRPVRWRTIPAPSSSKDAAPAPRPPPTFDWQESYKPFVFKDNNKPIVYGQVKIENLSDSKTLNEMPTPLQIFKATVKLEKLVEEILVPESIRYMEQKGNTFLIEPAEMKAFLGMNLVMSYHKLPVQRSYWSTHPDLAMPYISKVMPLHRFEAVRKALHFADNNGVHDPDDRAWKVRPLVTHFNAAFQDILSITEKQSIGEHMIKIRGHNITRQYLQGNTIKGFKIWCRCDARTGYLFQFEPYFSKKKLRDGYYLGESVVLHLTESLAGTGCQVFFNEFFNSPNLQHLLAEKDIRGCGTVRANCKNMPTSLTTDESMKRGDIVSVSSHGIACVKWMDIKGVLMLTNFIPPKSTTTVKRIEEGSLNTVDVRCPVMIEEYNQSAGGVDLMEESKVTYSEVDRKARVKYYLRIFFDLLDIGVNNAYIVYLKINEMHHFHEPPMKRIEFRQALARSLIGDFSSRQRIISTAVQRKRRAQMLGNCEKPEHTIEKSGKRKRCFNCAQKKIESRTANICSVCQVHLCFTSTRNCFVEFHQ